MNFLVQYKSILIALVCLPIIGFSQKNLEKSSPDFQYEDYSNFLQFMTKPYALTNQTLYLPKISDTIGRYFFVGEIATPEKEDNNNIDYYQLKRMSAKRLKDMENSWFVVVGYIADKIAYDKVYYADYEKQDFKTLRYDFIKLVVGNTEDTVFYKYDDFWNRYNFPFVPMSYYNANKNEYPKNKYSNDDLSLATYDRNSNYAFIPKNLVGEKLYLPILTQENYERLFNGTRLYNYDDDSRKYSFAPMPQGKAKQMQGKTYLVADWVHDAEGLTDVYLKLVVPGSRDTAYYKYPIVTQRSVFPFVVESFLKKAKEDYLYREFVYRGDKYKTTVIDTKRKTPVTINRGDVFQCIDFLVKDGKFQMLLRNKKGRKFYLAADYNLGDKLSFSHSLMEGNQVLKYRDTYATHYNAILQKELIPTMTINMAQMSWGKPEREVMNNFDGSNRHWFYFGNVYVIYKNNKLYRVAMIPKDLRL